MANPEHLKILKQGVVEWNIWREKNPTVWPDLSKIDLSDTDLSWADLSNANLSRAILNKANLLDANLSKANLTSAKLEGANLRSVTLFRAILSGTYFYEANLSEADLSGTLFFKTNLSGANLSKANLFMAHFKRSDLIDANLSRTTLFGVGLEEVQLVRTDLTASTLEKSSIYGISAWDIKKDGLIQKDLIITPPGEPEITVDDLEVAQFIYLMLNNQKIRDVIETITSKAVLILGRFTEERKTVLDALKDELRQRNYLPIVFDFENAGSKSVDETVNLLARMSRFVVADITDAKSIPQELRGIVPDNPSIPIVPLIWKAQREYAMFNHFRKYPWVLDLHEYDSPEILLENIISAIIAPAEQKVAELRER